MKLLRLFSKRQPFFAFAGHAAEGEGEVAIHIPISEAETKRAMECVIMVRRQTGTPSDALSERRGVRRWSVCVDRPSSSVYDQLQ